MTAPVIELRHASFGYADRAVVVDASLTIEAGSRTALVGANGCGKSTLVKGLLGLNDQLGGEVLLFGEPAARFTRRHLIGYVPQRHTLSATVAATVAEIVAIGRLPHRRLLHRPTARDRSAVREALEFVGLADEAGREVSELSGGQLRRVLIARALAAEPQVLIMDEPTAGVDQSRQAELALVMQRLADRGVTLLVVTHEVAPMANVLRRVLAMDAGRIIADAPIADVLDLPGGHGMVHPHHDPGPAGQGHAGRPERSTAGASATGHDGHHDDEYDQSRPLSTYHLDPLELHGHPHGRDEHHA